MCPIGPTSVSSYLTQYTARVVVDPSGSRDLIVGNFFDAELGGRLVAGGEFVVIRDFREGLVLLCRAGR
jgi:hypothetical protein